MKFTNLIFTLISVNLIHSISSDSHKSVDVSDMSYKVEALKNSDADLGEGPHWDIETQSLYFVDINEPAIYRYDYNEDKIYKSKIENEKFASFIIPLENKPNHFAVGIGRRVVNIEWDGRSTDCKIISKLFDVESDDDKFQGNRFNDGKADSMGRFYGGTMPSILEKDLQKTKKNGNLYRFDSNLTAPILLKDNVTVSNGLAWNNNLKKMYYIDSADIEVKEYDYDVATGEIKNPKVLIDFRVKEGEKQSFVPDGMTIDNEGFLYVATYGGSKVLKINPTNGKIEMEIKLPCEQITSAAFGGPNLDILFVTTASQGGKLSPAGQTFKITNLGAKGLQMNKLKL